MRTSIGGGIGPVRVSQRVSSPGAGALRACLFLVVLGLVFAFGSMILPTWLAWLIAPIVAAWAVRKR